MSDTYSVTHYSLPWGSLEVVTTNGVRTLTGRCKGCDVVTTQQVEASTNPFHAIRPEHAKDCAYLKRVTPRAPDPAVELLAGTVLGWKATVAIGAGLLGAGALMGYFL